MDIEISESSAVSIKAPAHDSDAKGVTPSTKSPKEEKKIVRKKKDKINAALRNAVWITYMGKDARTGLCWCCRLETISCGNFQCGHVKSEATGGETKLGNLRPICALCNTSMSVKNMEDFQIASGFNIDAYATLHTVKESLVIPKIAPISEMKKDDVIARTSALLDFVCVACYKDAAHAIVWKSAISWMGELIKWKLPPGDAGAFREHMIENVFGQIHNHNITDAVTCSSSRLIYAQIKLQAAKAASTFSTLCSEIGRNIVCDYLDVILDDTRNPIPSESVEKLFLYFPRHIYPIVHSGNFGFLLLENIKLTSDVTYEFLVSQIRAAAHKNVSGAPWVCKILECAINRQRNLLPGVF